MQKARRPHQQASQLIETERRGAIPQFLSKVIARTQFEIRHLFEIEASSFFVKLKLVPT